MLVGGGIVAGVVLIFIEMAYKRHYGKQEREEVVARAAFDRWRSAAKVIAALLILLQLQLWSLLLLLLMLPLLKLIYLPLSALKLPTPVQWTISHFSPHPLERATCPATLFVITSCFSPFSLVQ